MSHIGELQEVIQRLHGAEARHVESVPVKESFQGQTVWEGVVEVFDLIGHSVATRVYAWTHETDDPANPKRHVIVLHSGPVFSPLTAVRASIVQEFKLGRPEEA
jgi:hypothetical protein